MTPKLLKVAKPPRNTWKTIPKSWTKSPRRSKLQPPPRRNDMGERVDGCLVQPRAAGDTELTAACEGGSNFEGCAQKNTCEAWMKYGRKVVEETRETFVDGIMDSTS